MSPATAYTLGNPETYEPALDRGPVYKSVGGVVYRSSEEAQEVLDAHEGYLPPDWFDGLRIPGRVYLLELPGPVEDLTEERGHRLLLLTQVPVHRCP